MEPASRFLDCRVQNIEGQKGWEYNNILILDKNLRENMEVAEWQPVEIDITQQVIISQLCENEEIDLEADKDLESFVIKGSYLSLADFLEKLKATGLVYIENQKLRLLTDQCQCAVLPNGKFVAGENKSGRFTNWMMKEIAKSKNN